MRRAGTGVVADRPVFSTSNLNSALCLCGLRYSVRGSFLGGGRYYADGSDAIHIVPNSRNQPAEFMETRFPILVEKLGLRTDSGGAGLFRGGLGYEKEYRVLVDCNVLVTADRVRLGCYGINGGKAGRPFGVYVDVTGKNNKLGGLVDQEPIKAGQLLLVCTTGGGGWGDPLERGTDRVLLDVIQN